MARPLIGITASYDRESAAQQVDRGYVDAVVWAGGAPVLLPAVPEEALQPAVAALDGLVITGGNGIVEGLTGKLPEDLPEESPERTRRDRRALEAFLTTERPVLGICFGMQLINAHLVLCRRDSFAKSLDFRKDGIGRSRPDERVCVGVPFGRVAFDPPDEL